MDELVRVPVLPVNTPPKAATPPANQLLPTGSDAKSALAELSITATKVADLNGHQADGAPEVGFITQIMIPCCWDKLLASFPKVW
ncbi:hypothetical protein WJX82_001420 [Trebouxia sp. C0006]